MKCIQELRAQMVKLSAQNNEFFDNNRSAKIMRNIYENIVRMNLQCKEFEVSIEEMQKDGRRA